MQLFQPLNAMVSSVAQCNGFNGGKMQLFQMNGFDVPGMFCICNK